MKSQMITAKRTPAAAEGGAKGIMAVLAENFFSTIPGNLLGSSVKVEDPSIQVMGDDAIFHIVQNPFKVFSVGQDVVDGKLAHVFCGCSERSSHTFSTQIR
jgi:hypothetical protein